jgi:TolC family type I secretion outer membrane protein
MKLFRTIQPAVIIAISYVSFCSSAAGNDFPQFILATALKSDEIIAAQRELAIKKEGIKTVRSDYFPTLDADISGSWVRDDKKTSGVVDRSADITNPHTFTLTVDQNVWNGGQTGISEDISILDFKSQKLKLLDSIQQKILVLVKLNSEVFKLKKVLSLKEKNKTVLEYHLKSSKIRFKMGEISETDVFKSEARLASIVSEKIRAEYDLQIAIQKYQAEYKSEIVENLSIKPLDVELLPIDEIIEKNYSLKSDRYTQKSLNLQYKLQKRTNLPSLDVLGSVAHSRQTINRENDSTKLTAQLSLSVPLYDGGKNSSQVSASLYRLKKFQNDYNVSIKDLNINYNSKYGQYQSLLQQIRALRIEISAAGKALEATKKEVDVGTKAIVDLLDAEKELLDAKLNLLNEEERLVIITYEMKSLAGQLIPEKTVE